MLTIEKSKIEGGGILVRLSGPLDTFHLPDFQQGIMGQTLEGLTGRELLLQPRLILMVEGVTRVDSAGMAALYRLAQWRRRVRSEKIILANPRPDFLKALELMLLTHQFSIESWE